MCELSLLERALLFYGNRLPNHPRKWWFHAWLRRRLGVSVDRDVEVVRRGLRWSLNSADYGHNSLFWLGTKDTWDIHHLRHLVQPDDIVIDAGANFGYYAATLAAELGRRCQIHALEPNPANFDRLCSHIYRNGLEEAIHAHRVGVSDQAATVAMTQPPENSGHAVAAPGGDIAGVKLTTLDDFCDSVALDRLDLLILDVEGFEERALMGAARALTRWRPLVFVEFFRPVMEHQGSSPEAAERILTDLGYTLFAAQRDSLQPLTTMPVADLPVNAFCFHRDNRRFPAHLLHLSSQ